MCPSTSKASTWSIDDAFGRNDADELNL